ncbi:hypothetical protein PAAG_07289 [Paracoccidioides lutzii Pb01]|uniref:Single-strand DNA deaminase toxin A-like C-terminal domain-containing protein n=1 Tax=Paracoccidioides lutzii (strain ATCC MYA-826 / Pb01) TaxID=502779 RepID=C1H948_PARBA|nr:hypothetical protein PAAG_07289 [Paracoccidioides lutzii Pb01]EEH36871.1 hypothetical protein PAAG_07289 [Paracoccidioides lutzii Pb01]
MGGLCHSEWLSTRVSGKRWTQGVFNLAAIIGYTLSANPERDQRIQGHFQGPHAEKQLITCSVDRLVFLPEDKAVDLCFDQEIARLESEMVRDGQDSLSFQLSFSSTSSRTQIKLRNMSFSTRIIDYLERNTMGI